jgi:hypothetical protein
MTQVIENIKAEDWKSATSDVKKEGDYWARIIY